MQVVWTILLGLLVFGLMVFVHEFGHFICAKLSDVKVTEFSIGMGPRILKWGKGETKYSLRAFPIGGFVSMVGEDGEEDGEKERGSDDAGQPEAVEAASAVAQGRAFYQKPIWKRMIILIAGAFMNLLLGFVLLLVVLSMKSAIASRKISYFADTAVSNGENGLRLGDEIISLNGKAVHIGNDISYGLIRDQDGFVDFKVLRDGEEVTLTNVPFQTYHTEDGTQSIILDFKVEPLQKTFFTVLRESFYWTFSIVDLVWGSVIDLITGNFAFNQLSGPIGVVTVIGEAASVSLDSLLTMVGMITINIGVFNLLPFPALDGGRVVFLLIELIFRKPVPHKIENIINIAGLGLLMLLMIVVSVSDVIKLF